jgi:uridine phosphorylase
VSESDRSSIVRPRRLAWAAGIEKVIYIPWDLRSALFASDLRNLGPARRYEMFGQVFRLGNGAALYGATTAPLACIALEPLILMGVKEILLLGFCGSLHAGFRVGDAVSVSKAFAGEGTSRHYLPGRRRFLPSGPLRASLESTLKANGLEFKTGTIISTDAPYRETPVWLRGAIQRGAQTVDMETSAVFALAEYHRIRAASLQVVSDELFTGSWKSGFDDPRLRGRARDCFLPFLVQGRDRR